MKTLKTGSPEGDFMMPGEFSPHTGTIMIWPERPGSWNYGARAARQAFTGVISAIAARETVFVAVSRTGFASAAEMLLGGRVRPGSRPDTWRREAPENPLPEDHWRDNVELFLQETDDAWARDVGPTFLIRRHPVPGEANVSAVSWRFNAWGGDVDGLYAHWEKDDAFAGAFCRKYGYPCRDAAPFVLEGGAIHTDGEGTLLTTEACLLSPGRNPDLSREEIEKRLCAFLGVRKVLWLPRGIWGDETNEHVDNVCAFLRPGEVVLAWTDNRADPQYPLSEACLRYLENAEDACGRRLIVHKLPVPDVPVCIRPEDIPGFTFEEGEDQRFAGERLAASYVNFYFANGSVLLPVFGGENEASDRRAVALMRGWIPDREIIPVPARDILTGGGNIHCITQQIPAEPEVSHA